MTRLQTFFVRAGANFLFLLPLMVPWFGPRSAKHLAEVWLAESLGVPKLVAAGLSICACLFVAFAAVEFIAMRAVAAVRGNAHSQPEIPRDRDDTGGDC
jgi:hypothetical protein